MLIDSAFEILRPGENELSNNDLSNLDQQILRPLPSQTKNKTNK